MGLNFLLVVIGLIICFGGIYFRKVCAALLGLVWGAVLGIALIIVTAELLYEIDDSAFIIIIMIAVVVAVASAVYDKICAAINGFLSSLFILLLMAIILNVGNSLGGMLMVLILIAAVIAAVSYLYYQYAFIIITAFSGAFMASTGALGLMTDTGIGEMLWGTMIGGGSRLSPIMWGTIVLGIIGCFVQHQRFINVSGKSQTAKSISNQQFLDGLSNINGVISQSIDGINGNLHSPEEGSLQADILKEKLLFIAPVFAELIYPLFKGVSGISWVYQIAKGAEIGGMVYSVNKKNVKFSLVYQVPYFFGFLLFGKTTGRTMYDISIGLFMYIILWGILYITQKVVEREDVKPIVLSVVAIISSTYIIPLIRGRNVHLGLSVARLIQWTMVIVVVYLIYKIRFEQDIFSFISGTSPSISSIYDNKGEYAGLKNIEDVEEYCPNCGKDLIPGTAFCNQCGTGINKKCSNCGIEASKGDSFCKNCGTKL